MTEKIKVLNTFREKEHDNHVYEKNDQYPAEGYKATKNRVEYLQKENDEFDGKIFLETPKESDKTDGKKEEKKDTVKKSDDKK